VGRIVRWTRWIRRAGCRPSMGIRMYYHMGSAFKRNVEGTKTYLNSPSRFCSALLLTTNSTKNFRPKEPALAVNEDRGIVSFHGWTMGSTSSRGECWASAGDLLPPRRSLGREAPSTTSPHYEGALARQIWSTFRWRRWVEPTFVARVNTMCGWIAPLK